MAERIDVLAVMDRQLEFTAASDYSGASEDHRDFLAARDAVAELIEAAKEASGWVDQVSVAGCASLDRLDAALARVSGGAK